MITSSPWCNYDDSILLHNQIYCFDPCRSRARPIRLEYYQVLYKIVRFVCLSVLQPQHSPLICKQCQLHRYQNDHHRQFPIVCCSKPSKDPYEVVQLEFHEVLLLEMNPVSCTSFETVSISHWSVHHFEFPFEACLLMAEFLHRYFDADFEKEDWVFVA